VREVLDGNDDGGLARSFAEALSALEERPALVPAREFPGALRHLDQPGLYAWRVDAPGAQHLSRGLGLPLREGVIYVGQAGARSTRSGVPSDATLRKRIGRNHLGGKVRTSTFRCTLAAVLLGPLALSVLGSRRLEPASEARLTEWMQKHLSIAVWGAPSDAQLARLEQGIVAALAPPLNLEHLPTDGLRARLHGLRAIVIQGIADLWLAPDPALRDWRSILASCGQAFDGYRYATAVLGCECPEVADEVWRRFAVQGHFASSFAELRCALFWLQRCVHNAEQSPGWRPDPDLERRVARLYRAIQEAWRREWGVDSSGLAPSASRP